VPTARDRILSEFIDSWVAGRRPNIDEHLERAAQEDRAPLLEAITNFITWGPTPEYDDITISAIEAEPAMIAALSRHRQRKQAWPELLAERRRALKLSTAELAARLVDALGLSRKQAVKTERYLQQVEGGELNPARFKPQLLDALAETLRTSRQQLSGTAWRSMAAPAFRAGEDAAQFVRDDLELLADMASAPSDQDWDEVDDLFRGG